MADEEYIRSIGGKLGGNAAGKIFASDEREKTGEASERTVSRPVAAAAPSCVRLAISWRQSGKICHCRKERKRDKPKPEMNGPQKSAKDHKRIELN